LESNQELVSRNKTLTPTEKGTTNTLFIKIDTAFQKSSQNKNAEDLKGPLKVGNGNSSSSSSSQSCFNTNLHSNNQIDAKEEVK